MIMCAQFCQNLRKRNLIKSCIFLQEVLEGVDSIRYVGGGTHTASALEYAKDNYFSSVNGMRTQAAQVAVVITDGKSNDQSITTVEAEKLRDKVRERLMVTCGRKVNLCGNMCGTAVVHKRVAKCLTLALCTQEGREMCHSCVNKF